MNPQRIQKKVVNEITVQSWHQFLLGSAGAQIIVSLNKDYRKCKEKCLKTDKQDLCVQRCRDAFYEEKEELRQKWHEERKANKKG